MPVDVDNASADDRRAIGILDSGMGGLSVAREIRSLFPGEDLLYVADTAHCPYGNRPRDEICLLGRGMAEALVAREVKLIVVACNTISVACLADFRASFPVPFVGIVPAVKPAASATRIGRVAVLATPATFAGEVFDDLVRDFAAEVQVLRQICPGWVELVESGDRSSLNAEAQIRRALDPPLRAGVDTLVLGCTHYPFLRPLIERIVGPDVTVLDTGIPIALQVGRVLERRQLRSQRRDGGRLRCLTTSSDLGRFTRVFGDLMGFGPDSVNEMTLGPATVPTARATVPGVVGST